MNWKFWLGVVIGFVFTRELIKPFLIPFVEGDARMFVNMLTPMQKMKLEMSLSPKDVMELRSMGIMI